MGSFPTRTKLRNNLERVVHSYVLLSPIGTTWYWSKDGDGLRLGRWLQAWRKLTAAYRRGWLKKSYSGWLPVHRDQLWAQRSVTSMGVLFTDRLFSVFDAVFNFTVHLFVTSKYLCMKILTFHIKTFSCRSLYFFHEVTVTSSVCINLCRSVTLTACAVSILRVCI